MINSFSSAYNFINNTGSAGIVPGLDRIRKLLEILGNPQNQSRIIHVAGTNGKGSVCTFIASILHEAGYTVGRYISPTILDYRERIQISGSWISEDDFVRLTQKIYNAVLQMKLMGMTAPSTFEAETALAFLYFAEKKCDFVVLEVGMGGREDATNVIERPVLSVIVRIAMDHMHFLGNTIEEIAWNKSGIIKDERPLVYLKTDKRVSDVIEEQAALMHADVYPVCLKDCEVISCDLSEGLTFSVDGRGIYRTRLLGLYQTQNASIAIKACQVLHALNILDSSERITEDVIREGIKKAVWHGRFEVLMSDPLLIVDGGHNPDGAGALKASLNSYAKGRRIIYVMGVFADKDYRKMLEILSDTKALFIAFTPENARGLKCEILRQTAEAAGFKYTESADLQKDALDIAFSEYRPGDVIVHFGSLSTIKGLLNYLGKY